MPATPTRTPSYRLHKATGQAVVTLGGRDFYLGVHGSPESRAAYDRLLAEWLARGRRPPSPAGDAGAGVTVNELILAFLKRADDYYRKGGRPTSEPSVIRLALRPLRELYGRTPAAEFGPLKLKAVRQVMLDAGLTRTGINQRVDRIKRAFRWAVGEELVPGPVYESLRAVAGLRKGRCEARESPPVRPVPEAHVDAVLPHVSRQVGAMIQLQRLTGMRPGEVVAMRTGDLDTTGRLWAYTPPGHKTEHHGKGRTIYLGPKAQAVLGPWLRPEPNVPLFSPAEAEAERKAAMRAARRTRIQPSQVSRAKARPAKQAGPAYRVEGYRRAIKYGCDRAGVPGWHPHRLRHNTATMLRREIGLDAARAVLGHSSPVVTEVYAERDAGLAIGAMERFG